MKKIILFILSVVAFSCNQPTAVSYERIYENGTWGFVDHKQQTIIPLGVYDYLNTPDDHGMILATLKGKQGYIDIREHILIPFEYDYLGIFTDNDPAPATKKGKMGAIDRKGTIVIPFIYDNLGYFYKSGMALAVKDGKHGLIDKTGKEIIPVAYEMVDQTKDPEIILVSKNSKWALFTPSGKQLTDFRYDNIGEHSYGPLFIQDMTMATVHNKPTYISKEGRELFPPGTYDTAGIFTSKGFAIVSKNNKYGIISTNATELISLKYDNIELPTIYSDVWELFVLKKNNRLTLLNAHLKPVKEDVLEFKWDKLNTENGFLNLMVLKDLHKKYGVIKEDGSVVIPFIYDEFHGFDGEKMAIAKRNGKYGIVDGANNTVSSFVNDAIDKDRFSDYYSLKNNGLYTLINKKGKQIKTFAYDDMQPCYYDESHQFIVKKNGKYGMVTLEGKIVLPIVFDKISNWVEYGPEAHFVTKEGKKGMYSHSGKQLIPPIYEDLFYYTDTCITAVKNNKSGVISLSNTTVIPFDYDDILLDWSDIVIENKDPEFYALRNNNYLQLDKKNNIVRSVVTEKEIRQKFFK